MDNIATLCLEKNLQKIKADDPIVYKFHWEGNYWDGDIHDYAQLSLETVSVVAKKCAHVLRQKGVSRGDTVLAFVHTVIQLPIIALGCAHVGATFVFIHPSEQDPEVLARKIAASRPKTIVAVDGFWRGAELVAAKKNLDAALLRTPHRVESVLVIRHTGANPGTPSPSEEFVGRRPSYRLEVPMEEGRDFPWSKAISTAPEPEAVDGAVVPRPEDVVAAFLRTTPQDVEKEELTAKTLLEAVERRLEEKAPLSPFWNVGFPDRKEDVVALVAAMIAGVELVLFEGILSHPDPSRIGQVVSKYEVRQIAIWPSDVEFLMKFPDYVHFWKMGSLRSVIYKGQEDDVDEMKWLKENFTGAEVEALLD
ncbi:hypothetical protein QR680_012511 [Steinernema hermaphroditum]|uniref:acetate--CoA ligase n=1 Tax=Steinernema hermaphroditum TaxID=289476 RepID=A0AA39M0M1_9BILA|nr:hypothetical protein QR680_012511 [Steinernema hermaphroditum]